jgi:hypothetical protein
MHGKRQRPVKPADYLVIVQLLNRGPRGRTKQAIYRALDYERDEIDAAIAELERDGVLTDTGRSVSASPALARLAGHNLIAL